MNAYSNRSVRYATKGLRFPGGIALLALLVIGAIAVYVAAGAGNAATQATGNHSSPQTDITQPARDALNWNTHVYVVGSQAEAERVRAGIRDAEMEAWLKGDDSLAWLGRSAVVVLDDAGAEQLFAGEMNTILQGPSSGGVVIEDLRQVR
jgi:hypothetical protein